MRELISAAALLALAACSQPLALQQGSGEIVGFATITDGDTIRINGTRIRLNGYDSPERDKACGGGNVYQRATTELDRFIAGREVRCRIVDEPDRYGRQIAQCSVGGSDFGDHMVSEGWGRDWP